MASPNVYISGIGGSSGAELATLSPLLMSGNALYVSSLTGTDAASPAGRERNKPLRTLAQAHTNCSQNDIIVFLAGHTEVLAASQLINTNGIVLIGEGQGTSRPKFTRNADVVMFDSNAPNFYISNIYFVASTFTSTKSRLRLAGADSRVYGCYFEHGASDTGPGLEYITAASDALIRDTTFISTAPTVAAQPNSAIKVTNSISGLEMDRVTFDGGASGWSNTFAFDANAASITRLWATNIDLLNDSDMLLATGSTGFIHPRNKSGSARIVWTA